MMYPAGNGPVSFSPIQGEMRERSEGRGGSLPTLDWLAGPPDPLRRPPPPLRFFKPLGGEEFTLFPRFNRALSERTTPNFNRL